jgi:hypothetical protein
LLLPDDWKDSSSKTDENAEDKKSNSSDYLFHDMLKSKNRKLVKACAGDENEFSKILQEPIG